MLGPKLCNFSALTSTPMMDWMDKIASGSVLNQAYHWLCQRRLEYCPNDDVWDPCWRREEVRPTVQ
jgi:hypothetical protein